MQYKTICSGVAVDPREAIENLNSKVNEILDKKDKFKLIQGAQIVYMPGGNCIAYQTLVYKETDE